jgi:hypothetical protein
MVNKAINNLNGVYSGITRHNINGEHLITWKVVVMAYLQVVPQNSLVDTETHNSFKVAYRLADIRNGHPLNIVLGQACYRYTNLLDRQMKVEMQHTGTWLACARQATGSKLLTAVYVSSNG